MPTLTRKDHLITALIGLAGMILSALVLQTLLNDFAREQDFLLYRFASNLRNGSGLVYNPGEYALLTLNPGWPVAVSLISGSSAMVGWLSIGIYALCGTLLYRLLRRSSFDQSSAVFIVALWFLSWPLWNGLRSSYTAAFLLVLVSLEASAAKQKHVAALMSGAAVLFHISAVIPGILALVVNDQSGNSRKQYLLVAAPISLWAIYALITYDHFMIPEFVSYRGWQDTLWLLAFVLLIGTLNRLKLPPLLWIFPAWTAIDLMLVTIWQGHLPVADQPALSLSVAITIALALRQITVNNNSSLAALPITGLFVAMLTLAPPATPDVINHDLATSETLSLPNDASLAHFQTDALAHALKQEGEVYRLDGQRSPLLLDFAERNDIESALIRYAPDYIYDPNNMVDRTRLDGLYATIDNQLLLERIEETSTWKPMKTVEIPYSAETRITGYALNTLRAAPGDILRLRLDWQLERAPELDIGIRLELVDIAGQVIGSSMSVLPPDVWQPLELSTFHVLTVGSTAPAGIASLNLVVEHRAALMGNHEITSILIPPPVRDITELTPITSLGPVELLEASVENNGTLLEITTQWSTTERLDQDYLIFTHLTPAGGVEPVAQADGAPASGRFPTRFWQPGDLITDIRQIDLSQIPPGDYVIRYGYYLLSGERLNGNQGDSITIAHVRITESGEITVEAAGE